MKKFLAKPITWGDICKVTGVASLIGMIITAIAVAYIWWDDLTEWAAGKICARRFGKAIDKVNKEQGA